MQRRKKQEEKKDDEATKARDEILRIHINCKSLDPVELTKEQQLYVAEVTRYWLIKHGCKVVRLSGKNEHYSAFAMVGIILGFVLFLVLLYYLPV